MALRDELGRYLPQFNPDDVVNGPRKDVTVKDVLDKYSYGLNKESSCVGNYDYNLENQELTITFPGNVDGRGGRGTWVYTEVPLNVFIEFAQASSLGTYFNLYIRDQYSFERVG